MTTATLDHEAQDSHVIVVLVGLNLDLTIRSLFQFYMHPVYTHNTYTYMYPHTGIPPDWDSAYQVDIVPASECLHALVLCNNINNAIY